MNIMQWVIAAIGLLVVAAVWLIPILASRDLDIAYSTIVSVLASAVTGGFMFSCKNIGK